MKTPWIDPRAARFIDYLQQFKNDRGALACLRGGLSEARRPNAWPLLGGFVDSIGNVAFETVAALWANVADSGVGGGNLGATLARLVTEHNSVEGRFKRLLTCDRDEILSRIVPVVRTAQAKGARIDCVRLLSDLLQWNDRVRVEWAKAFWGAEEPDGGIMSALLDKEAGK